jgi:hypothetical protein
MTLSISVARSVATTRTILITKTTATTPPNRTTNFDANGWKLCSYYPDAIGKCSNCSESCTGAQDFYEHLEIVCYVWFMKGPLRRLSRRLLLPKRNLKVDLRPGLKEGQRRCRRSRRTAL